MFECPRRANLQPFLLAMKYGLVDARMIRPGHSNEPFLRQTVQLIQRDLNTLDAGEDLNLAGVQSSWMTVRNQATRAYEAYADDDLSMYPASCCVQISLVYQMLERNANNAVKAGVAALGDLVNYQVVEYDRNSVGDEMFRLLQTEQIEEEEEDELDGLAEPLDESDIPQ